MFDVGFSEIALIFVIALVVLGPERLPKLARTLGNWTGRARAYWQHLSAELEREAHLKDLRDVRDTLRESEQNFKVEINQTQNSIQDSLRPPKE